MVKSSVINQGIIMNLQVLINGLRKTSSARLIQGALLIATCLSAYAYGSEKPNIIFILADDLGYNQVGAYGDTPIKTPNIDLLAENGIRFTQAYSGNTVCSPSRVSLFTGRDGRFMTNNSNTVQLQEIDVTMAQVLNQNG